MSVAFPANGIHDECGLCRTKSTNGIITKSDFTELDVIDSHAYSSSNKNELTKGEICGCFSYCKVFDSTEITEYLTGDNNCDRGGTAICPYCGIDSVIGKSSGYPIIQDFLEAMNKKWF